MQAESAPNFLPASYSKTLRKAWIYPHNPCFHNFPVSLQVEYEEVSNTEYCYTQVTVVNSEE